MCPIVYQCFSCVSLLSVMSAEEQCLGLKEWWCERFMLFPSEPHPISIVYHGKMCVWESPRDFCASWNEGQWWQHLNYGTLVSRKKGCKPSPVCPFKALTPTNLRCLSLCRWGGPVICVVLHRALFGRLWCTTCCSSWIEPPEACTRLPGSIPPSHSLLTTSYNLDLSLGSTAPGIWPDSSLQGLWAPQYTIYTTTTCVDIHVTVSFWLHSGVTLFYYWATAS